ncbi:hypothetical protein DXG03_006719 [Asterophora parasitica]|uniref:Inhibitor I9 domain-containing protein n=1 Tax=Asterophora parasitica TaxID=117018 RepID=A0A9P7G8J1_9AGAR|nr:hypothetical protein DXG03_006719 [Asterophora parasitica]
MTATRTIVVFKDTATTAQIQDLIAQVKQQGGRITNVYDVIFKGFAAEIPEGFRRNLESVARIRGNPIDYIGAPHHGQR